MDDIIALVCPSCGGKIQVEKNLEKMFCTHCGTQLLLRQGTDGLLTPMMARDLNASAQLKETQNTMMMIENIKHQIEEMEVKWGDTKMQFWVFTLNYKLGTKVNTDVTRLVNKYTVAKTGQKVDDLWRKQLPGLRTLEEFQGLYQFITRPENHDQTASNLAQVLDPVVQMGTELVEKKQKLKALLDSIA